MRAVVRAVPRFVRRNAAWLVALAALVIATYWLFGRRESDDDTDLAEDTSGTGLEPNDDVRARVQRHCESGADIGALLRRKREFRKYDNKALKDICDDAFKRADEATRNANKARRDTGGSSRASVQCKPGREPCTWLLLQDTRPCFNKAKTKCCRADGTDCENPLLSKKRRQSTLKRIKSKKRCREQGNTWYKGVCTEAKDENEPQPQPQSNETSWTGEEASGPKACDKQDLHSMGYVHMHDGGKCCKDPELTQCHASAVDVCRELHSDHDELKKYGRHVGQIVTELSGSRTRCKICGEIYGTPKRYGCQALD
jgi:hypothetical protein